MNTISAFYSVEEAASILGYTTGRIRQLLRAGTLQGQKFTERSWMVDAASVRRAKHLGLTQRGRKWADEKKV